MEPTNHPFGKENDLPNLQGIMFHVNLQGCKLLEDTRIPRYPVVFDPLNQPFLVEKNWGAERSPNF